MDPSWVMINGNSSQIGPAMFFRVPGGAKCAKVGPMLAKVDPVESCGIHASEMWPENGRIWTMLYRTCADYHSLVHFLAAC